MNMKNKDNMSVVDFQQLNILLNDGSKVLIDVRYKQLRIIQIKVKQHKSHKSKVMLGMRLR